MTSSNVACPSSRAVLTSGARRSDKEAGATMSGQCAWFMTDLATEPDQGAIHLSGTPAESITEAAECRSVCKPDRAGSQARIAAASSARNALRGSQRSLSSVVNTYVVRCQAEPALRRSAACQVRTSRNTRSVGERGIRRWDRWHPVLRKAT